MPYSKWEKARCWIEYDTIIVERGLDVVRVGLGDGR